MGKQITSMKLQRKFEGVSGEVVDEFDLKTGVEEFFGFLVGEHGIDGMEFS